MALAGSKTPVSILQEYLVTRNITPTYTERAVQTGANETTFTVRVSVGKYSADGHGRSKQLAKHRAARNLMDILGIIDNDPQVAECFTEAVTPAGDDIAYNAVGKLTEMCVEKAIPEAKYELINTEGPPHARIFTFKCSVSHLSEQAVAATKKQAKRLAAYAMVKRLSEMYKENLNPLVPLGVKATPKKSFENIDKIKEMYLGVSRFRLTATKNGFIADHHKNIKCLHEESPKLAELLAMEDFQGVNVLNELQIVADELKVQLRKIEGKEYGGVFLTLTVIPNLTAPGDSYEEAAIELVGNIKVFYLNRPPEE